MYVLLYQSFVCLSVYAYAFTRVQGPLRECPRAGRFRATLLLRTICMRSQRLKGVSGVASHTQTNKQTFEVRVNLPTLCVSKARCGFQQVCILILMKFRKLIQNLVQNFMCYVGRRPTQPIPQPILHILGCSSPLVQLDCFSYNLLK